MPIKLSISIVLYQTPVKDIKNVLYSLSLSKTKFHLFIIDNSPTDILKDEFSKGISCVYIHFPHNPGYGSAHNEGMKRGAQLNCEFHLVLNADIHFNSDVISPMIEYMEKGSTIGQMMPKILKNDGEVQYLCKLVPTPLDMFLRRFSFNKFSGANNINFELRNSGYDKIMFVPYLSGCFMLLRHAALREIGLFDERFFMYPEDIDLTRRIAERYETIYFPKVCVTHEFGAASHKSKKMLAIHIFNLIKYFNKWGWIFDSGRKRLNAKTLKQFQN